MRRALLPFQTHRAGAVQSSASCFHDPKEVKERCFSGSNMILPGFPVGMIFQKSLNRGFLMSQQPEVLQQQLRNPTNGPRLLKHNNGFSGRAWRRTICSRRKPVQASSTEGGKSKRISSPTISATLTVGIKNRLNIVSCVLTYSILLKLPTVNAARWATNP
jgi:hypothetical protein